MLNFDRTHDFQIYLSPCQAYPATVNPPSFNWPSDRASEQCRLELVNVSSGQQWSWERVNSPLQLSFELPRGQYQWRLLAASNENAGNASAWNKFEITNEQPSYLAPTAEDLFQKCDGRAQWLMYFDEDLELIKSHCHDVYPKLKHTASLAVPMSEIRFPDHYRRGQEEGKREAIANVRKWIDRDLISHALLYRIWGDEQHGQEAARRLLQFCEWSVEGPASLLRPCTWGDEVGCSLARNLFLAYHWLAPLLNENEKGLFVRPMLVRIARQISRRLIQDDFKQHPGHSHTSRLPAYLGVAGLALYREHDRAECQRWLDEALEIYRGVLPFYGGSDGSWVEGPFYASTYSKWFHPFFLSVERLTGFSFYEHPFYKNFLDFARDFIAPQQTSYPFGDGFWCRRDGGEWPGFFAQNPLRIYTGRSGDAADLKQSQRLEDSIVDYRLHLLDVVPTVNQIAHESAARKKQPGDQMLDQPTAINHYYAHAGLGKLTRKQMALYYRASAFGNSSHRHGDQGNIGFFENGVGVLVPTGSFGYRFGSQHHRRWTRQTIAHNLPLVDGDGQILDHPNAVGRVIRRRTESDFHVVTLDLSESYAQPLQRFYRTLVLLEDVGLIMVDRIGLNVDKSLNWRLHSGLQVELVSDDAEVLLSDLEKRTGNFKCCLLNHRQTRATLTRGYTDELNISGSAIESDANADMFHIDWQLAPSRDHQVVACCVADGQAIPQVRRLDGDVLELKLEQRVVSISIAADGDL
jgi:hypothetical protein